MKLSSPKLEEQVKTGIGLCPLYSDALFILNYGKGLNIIIPDDVSNTKKLAVTSKKYPWQFTKKI